MAKKYKYYVMSFEDGETDEFMEYMAQIGTTSVAEFFARSVNFLLYGDESKPPHEFIFHHDGPPEGMEQELGECIFLGFEGRAERDFERLCMDKNPLILLGEAVTAFKQHLHVSARHETEFAGNFSLSQLLQLGKN